MATISSEQVRQPLYTEGVAQWQNFEPWLGPLKDALAEPATTPSPQPASISNAAVGAVKVEQLP